MPDPVHPTEQYTMSFAIASAEGSLAPPERYLAHLVPDDQARERFLDVSLCNDSQAKKKAQNARKSLAASEARQLIPLGLP